MNRQHRISPLDGLRTRPAGLRDREAFWQDFAARASLAPRQAPDCERLAALRPPLAARPWAWAAALPAIGVFLAVALFATLPARGPAADRGGLRAYEIGTGISHGGVIILTDEPSKATILWIVDLAEPV